MSKINVVKLADLAVKQTVESCHDDLYRMIWRMLLQVDKDDIAKSIDPEELKRVVRHHSEQALKNFLANKEVQELLKIK